MSEPLKATLDIGAALAILGSLTGYLTPLAAVVAMIWHGIQIYNAFKKK